MDDTQPSDASPPASGASRQRPRRLGTWFTSLRRIAVPAVIVLLLGSQAALFWQIRSLREALAVQSFDSEMNHLNAEDDVIQPSVGVIQFLKSGYSVTIDSLSYSSAGLQLAGKIGNPRLINLSSLTLELTAQRPRWGRRKEWETNPFDFMFDRGIGTAEVAVGDLVYGRQVMFHAIIPNVRQEKDSSFLIKVGFKGARFALPF